MSVSDFVSPDELLTLTVTNPAPSVRVSAVGEVDTCSAPWLVAALKLALEEARTVGARAVVVDLEAVTFLDSSGVRALAAAYRRAVAAGIRLQVSAPRRAVLRPLQLSGVWRLLDAHEPRRGAGCVA